MPSEVGLVQPSDFELDLELSPLNSRELPSKIPVKSKDENVSEAEAERKLGRLQLRKHIEQVYSSLSPPRSRYAPLDSDQSPAPSISPTKEPINYLDLSYADEEDAGQKSASPYIYISPLAMPKTSPAKKIEPMSSEALLARLESSRRNFENGIAALKTSSPVSDFAPKIEKIIKAADFDDLQMFSSEEKTLAREKSVPAIKEVKRDIELLEAELAEKIALLEQLEKNQYAPEPTGFWKKLLLGILLVTVIAAIDWCMRMAIINQQLTLQSPYFVEAIAAYLHENFRWLFPSAVPQ